MTDSERPSPAPSRALRLYLQLVIAAGAIALAHAAIGAARTPQPLGWLMLAGIAIVTGFFRLTFASDSANIAIDDTFFITTAILFGPGPATLAIAASGLIISYRRAKSYRQIAFNTAALALSMSAGAQAFFLLGHVVPLAIGHAPITPLVLPLLALSVVYFSLNSGLTAIVVGLDTGQPALTIWKRHFRWLGVGYLGAASVAFCLILLVQQSSIASVIMVLPLLLIFHLTLKSSFGRLDDARRHLGELDRLYLSTVETLAMAIDAKDDVTHSHVRRVQAYAVGLAQALGVEDELSIKAIKAAALLHDTGKLAVPEHILNKPGKLTESEFAQMKLHVDVGADILSLVEFPYPVVPIVRCHHENWDGSGYPRGVKGEDIPIGARILSVVDCFDALTSDRPYRRRMTEEAALDILRDRRGTMYDPRVVDTFITVYRDIAVDDGEAPGHREVLRRIAESRTEAPRQDFAATAAAAATGASDDVLAFVSLARLASGEGGTADVLALSSNLIADILPSATGAWYFPDAGRLQLTVVETFGPASHVLRGTGMKVGQRLTGWVAASRQPIGNSDAALDLEGLAEQASPALRSCTSVPLMMGETLVGVLSLYSASTDAFDENRCRLIQMLAPHIASALHAASRHASAAKDAAAHAEKAGLRLIAKR
jgi:putative nucleotidyltransferase with HDIG domain